MKANPQFNRTGVPTSRGDDRRERAEKWPRERTQETAVVCQLGEGDTTPSCQHLEQGLPTSSAGKTESSLSKPPYVVIHSGRLVPGPQRQDQGE